MLLSLSLLVSAAFADPGVCIAEAAVGPYAARAKVSVFCSDGTVPKEPAKDTSVLLEVGKLHDQGYRVVTVLVLPDGRGGGVQQWVMERGQ